MKTVEKLRADLARLGATLDAGDYTLNCDAPSGYVWRANGCCSYPIHFATSRQSWLAQAVRAELPALRLGLVKVTDPDEIAEHRHLLGDDDWGAPAGAPDRVGW